MSLEDHWPELDARQIGELAGEWLSELRNPSLGDEVGQSIVMMGFMAPPEQQWLFVVTAVSLAETDDELGHIAAGPVECLLSRNGEKCIGLFEDQARRERKFARMLTGAWQHLMTEEVWQRVQGLQAGVDEPLRDNDAPSA